MTTDCIVTPDVSATLRDLTMHHHDPPFILFDFNPWSRSVRADSETARAWNNGSWSGAEWLDAITVPITILVRSADALPGTRRWLALQQQLAAAFAPSHVDIPLEFSVDDGLGGTDDYVIYGRPRLLEPAVQTALRGWAITRAAFRLLDPIIYSGGLTGLHSRTLALPLSSGGLTLPFTVPFIIGALVSSGRAAITNAGNVETSLLIRINGPVVEPRITLASPDGNQVLIYNGTVDTGDYLELDTRAHTATLNGAVSRRGLVSGDWPLLSPGTWEIAYDAAVFNADTTMVVEWRDAWI